MESDAPNPPKGDEKSWKEKREAAKASAIGIQFVISIAIGAFGGKWLDEKFGTTPWLLLAGVVLGAVAAFRDLYRLARSQASSPPDPKS